VHAGPTGTSEELTPPSAAGVGRGSQLRIGDAERDAVVQLLGAAFAEGYLDRSELEARTDRALTATTDGELEVLRRDLPVRLQPAAAIAPPVGADVARRAARTHLAFYLAGVALMIGIWLVTAVLFGAGYFWPVWPILGWGIGVAAHVLPVRRQLASVLTR
jgi:hypothetical protein